MEDDNETPPYRDSAVVVRVKPAPATPELIASVVRSTRQVLDQDNWTTTQLQRDFPGGFCVVRKMSDGWRYTVTFMDDRDCVHSGSFQTSKEAMGECYEYLLAAGLEKCSDVLTVKVPAK